jgi:hypothetical protein
MWSIASNFNHKFPNFVKDQFLLAQNHERLPENTPDPSFEKRTGSL